MHNVVVFAKLGAKEKVELLTLPLFENDLRAVLVGMLHWYCFKCYQEYL
jgi:hypothetical protein